MGYANPETRVKPVSARYFDCRRYLKPGDLITYGGFDREESECANGTLPLKEAYEQFVILWGRYTEITINRWDIMAVNGHKIEGGCFKNIPSLFERGMNGKGRIERICLSAHDKA